MHVFCPQFESISSIFKSSRIYFHNIGKKLHFLFKIFENVKDFWKFMRFWPQFWQFSHVLSTSSSVFFPGFWKFIPFCPRFLKMSWMFCPQFENMSTILKNSRVLSTIKNKYAHFSTIFENVMDFFENSRVFFTIWKHVQHF